jgi:hypothetical protein
MPAPTGPAARVSGVATPDHTHRDQQRSDGQYTRPPVLHQGLRAASALQQGLGAAVYYYEFHGTAVLERAMEDIHAGASG